MNEQDRRRAIVTGASSGIGREIAKQFAEEGWRVMAVARRADLLESLAGEGNGRIVPFACDLVKDETPGEVFALAEREFGGVDLLVNNAGVSWVAETADTPDEKLDEILDLNVRALMRMCREAIPTLAASGSGQIINVSSVAAHLSMMGLAVYCSSKAAVNMFSRVLAKELAPRGIRVNVLSPPGTDTEIFGKAGVEVDSINRDALIPAGEMARMAVLMTQWPASVDMGELVIHKQGEPIL
jgi:NAD(P)-dependent dehydrogenase (short-subunit alcohol dehydrogenase family)